MSLKSWFVEKGAKYAMNKLWEKINGSKTYIAGAAFIFTGLGLMLQSYLDNRGWSAEGWQKILEGITVIGARSAISKMEAPK